MLSCPIGSCDYTSGIYYSGSIRLGRVPFRLLFWAILLIWTKGWWVPGSEMPKVFIIHPGYCAAFFLLLHAVSWTESVRF